MGEIYLAVLRRQGAFEKQLVIKKILPTLSQDQEFVQMFNREARIAALLNHQNIVQVYDFGTVGDEYFIAMEYVDGVDLRTALKALGPPPDKATFALLMGIARGLDYAHRLKDRSGKPLELVHRDVSPGNVLLSREGEVKLTDFGLVTSGIPDHETEVGAMKGKYAYMSPEQTYGDPVDARSDVFSWGIVAHEVLLGERPFSGDMLETVAAIRDADYAPIDEERVPEAISALVANCLRRHCDERPQSVQEILACLSEIGAQQGWSGAEKELAEWIRPVVRELAEGQSSDGLERTQVGDKPIRDEVLARTATAPRSGDDVLRRAQPEDGQGSGGSKLKILLSAGLLAAVIAGGTAVWNGRTPNVPNNVADPPPSDFSVTINTEPHGSEVSLDGTVVGLAPISLENVTEGPHQLSTTLQGYQTVESTLRPEDLNPGPDGVRTFHVFLRPLPATVSFVSTPAGAEIWSDGAQIGTTPTELSFDDFGVRQFVLQSEGYAPQTAEFDLGPGTTFEQIAVLVPVQVLSFSGEPAGSTVAVTAGEGVQRGCVSPCELEVEAGSVSVSVSADGHHPYEFNGVPEEPAFAFSLREIDEYIELHWRSADLQLSGENTLQLRGREASGTLMLASDGLSGHINVNTTPAGDGRVDLSIHVLTRPWTVVRFDDQSCESPCSIGVSGLGAGRHRLRLWPSGERDNETAIRLTVRQISD